LLYIPSKCFQDCASRWGETSLDVETLRLLLYALDSWRPQVKKAITEKNQQETADERCITITEASTPMSIEARPRTSGKYPQIQPVFSNSVAVEEHEMYRELRKTFYNRLIRA
jgi:hypothetical protein